MQTKAKKHLKVLIIGRTGSGKTTFINCMVNHFYRNPYDGTRMIPITQNLSVKNVSTAKDVGVRLACSIPQFELKQSDNDLKQSNSQTSKPNIYDFESDHMKLSIVDTPGLGDTGGMEVDTAHSDNICQAAAALTDFNAIIFVHKATDCRRDVMLSYMIREFQGILPKDCSKNFIVCFTNALNPKKIDALAALKEMNIPVDKYFTFENNYLIPKHLWLEKTGVGSDPALQIQYKSTLRKMEESWDDAQDTFWELIQHAESLIPQPGHSLLELSLKRQIIWKLISENSNRITELHMEMAKLESRREELESLQDKMTKNQDFENQRNRLVRRSRYYERTKFIEQSIKPQKITQCLLCKNLCHDPCHLDQVYAKGDINLNNCTAMGGTDSCQHYDCQHHRWYHWHTQRKTVQITEKILEEYLECESVSLIDYAKKATFTEAQKDSVKVEEAVKALEAEVAAARTRLSAIYKIVAHLHKQLEEECQHAGNEFFLDYLKYKRDALYKRLMSQQERQTEIDILDQAESDYKNLKLMVEKTPKSTLTPQEKAKLQSEFQARMSEMAETIRSYQGDRSVFCLLTDEDPQNTQDSSF